MKQPPVTLDATQRWMQAVITHPDSTTNGLVSETATVHIDVSTENLQQVVTPSSTLSAEERLAIYGHSYHARLLECLNAEFAVLRTALGEDLFDLFAQAYLHNYPSQSYTLDDLGKDFPEFLAETRETDSADPAEKEWQRFIIDLARLERAYSELFDGPGCEGEQILNRDQLGNLLSDRLRSLFLQPVSCLRLLAFQSPVHDYFHAVRRDQQPEPCMARKSYVAMYRKEFVVRTVELSIEEFQFLQALLTGESIQNSLTNIGAKDDHSRGVLLRALEDWCDRGFFLSLIEAGEE